MKKFLLSFMFCALSALNIFAMKRSASGDLLGHDAKRLDSNQKSSEGVVPLVILASKATINYLINNPNIRFEVPVENKFSINFLVGNKFETQDPFKFIQNLKENKVGIFEYLESVVNDPVDFTGETLLHKAIKERSLYAVKVLVKLNIDVNKADKLNKITPLHLAAMGFTEAIEFLINSDAKVNLKDAANRTPLMIACRYNPSAVAVLIKNGAYIRIYNLKNKNSFMIACKYNPMVIREFINKDSSIVNCSNVDGVTPLMIACEYKSEAVKVLLNNSANPNVVNDKGYTPLMIAIESYNFDATKDLIEKGANINAANEEEFNRRVLTYAIERSNSKAVKLLLEKNVDLDYTDDVDGNTPLMFAAMGCPKIVDLLFNNFSERHIIDIDARNNEEKTALMLATEWGKIKSLDKLIKYGADINLVDNNNQSALIITIKEDSYYGAAKFKRAKFLINHGADINAANNQDLNRRVLNYAIMKNETQIINYLLKKGVELNYSDDNGDTPLIYAVELEQIETVKKLIECGAGVNLKNNNNQSALNIAQSKNNQEIINILTKSWTDSVFI